MAKVKDTTGFRQIDIDLIESFDDDLGWLFLDEPDEVKRRIIEEGHSN